jgi:MFS family permease
MNNTESGSDRPGDRAVQNEREFPREGGRQAWLTVCGSALVFFASFGFINSFGFFQTYYQEHMLKNYAPSTIAFIGTLQITLLYLLSPVTGALFDSYGLKPLYMVSAIGCTGSLLALSFTREDAIWQQFLSQGVLFGLAVPFGVQPANSVVGQYFDKKRALAMSIVAGSSSIGGVCMPIIFSKLVPKIGFAWSLRVGALLFICCFVPAILISRANQPPKPLKKASELIDFSGYKDMR